jgi:hypothetical protein
MGTLGTLDAIAAFPPALFSDDPVHLFLVKLFWFTDSSNGKALARRACRLPEGIVFNNLIKLWPTRRHSVQQSYKTMLRSILKLLGNFLPIKQAFLILLKFELF